MAPHHLPDSRKLISVCGLAQNQGKCDLSLYQNQGNMRTIKYLVVHCTATPHSTKIESIQNYWRTNLKWKASGYHKVVKANGEVVTLAPDEAICNGVAGYNSVSLHVSYIGGINFHGDPVDNRTQGQKDALSMVLHEWRAKYPTAKILGHRDFPKVAKACPSFNAAQEYAHI